MQALQEQFELDTDYQENADILTAQNSNGTVRRKEPIE